VSISQKSQKEVKIRIRKKEVRVNENESKEKKKLELEDKYKVSKKKILNKIKNVQVRIFNVPLLKGYANFEDNTILINIPEHSSLRWVVHTFLHEIFHHFFPDVENERIANKFASYYMRDKDIYIRITNKIFHILFFKAKTRRKRS